MILKNVLYGQQVIRPVFLSAGGLSPGRGDRGKLQPYRHPQVLKSLRQISLAPQPVRLPNELLVHISTAALRMRAMVEPLQ